MTAARQLEEVLQTAPIDALVAVAQGRVSAFDLVLDQLASRGLDLSGRWVGFEAARAAAESAKRAA